MTYLSEIRTRHKSVLYIAVLITFIIIFLTFSNKVTQNPFSKLKNIYLEPEVDFEVLSQKGITILHWTNLWDSVPDYSYHFDSSKCSILETERKITTPVASKIFDVPCQITFDRSYLKTSHALIFHSWDLKHQTGLPKEPRNAKQIWIYRQQESPLYTSLDLKPFSKVFNWTMTFRRDSDVYFPYGYFTPRLDNSIPTINTTNLMSTKRRLVAWIVSNCDAQSKREHFVKQLQKFIPVDIYGRCGKNCPTLNQNAAGVSNCYDYVQSTHKFYLSFENSLCMDYITEKFFNVLRRNMVPIVYGGVEPEEEYLKIAPNHSFINARQFKSAEDLANYLVYLDKNDDEYLKYFKWKDEYDVVTSEVLGWCNLCQRLYERVRRLEVEREYKWYSDLYRWWNYRQSFYGNENYPSCIPPSEIQIN